MTTIRVHEELYRQGKLALHTPIYICGLGALGGNLVVNLTAMGYDALTGVDYDRVGMENIGTQPYPFAAVGKLKTESLRAVVFERFRARFDALNLEIDQANLPRKFKGARLIVDALDNSEGREAVAAFGKKYGVRVLHAGMNNDFAVIQWDTHYKVPTGKGIDGCEYPLALNLIQLTVAVLSETIANWLETGREANHTISLRNLNITEF